jgi:hypothetical protein
MLELERLDSYLVGLEPRIAKGDHQAVNSAVRISERRSRLLGLDVVPPKEEGRDPADLSALMAFLTGNGHGNGARTQEYDA